MPDFEEPHFYQLTVGEIFKHLETRAGGLSLQEAQQRLRRYGPNVLKEPSRYSMIRGFLRQFTHFLALLLLVTATFAGIVIAQVANVFACRSDRVPLSQLNWFGNPLLLWGIVTELVVLALIIYTPWGNAIFATSPLPAWSFGPLLLGALMLLLAEESRKLIVSRFKNRRAGGVTRQAGTL